MKYAEELKDKLCKEIDRIGKKTTDLSEKDLEYLYKMTDVVKNLDKIEMLEGEGDDMSMRGSYRGGSYDSMARDGRGRSRDSYNDGSYDDGNSYARRGKHYVRGHYSYDEGGDSYARNRRMSYDDAKDKLMTEMGELMQNADPKQREILKKAMREIDED